MAARRPFRSKTASDARAIAEGAAEDVAGVDGFASGTVTETVSTSTMSPAVTVTNRSCDPGLVIQGAGRT